MGPFSYFELFGLCDFSKIYFRDTKSIDLRQHHGFIVEIMGSSLDALKSPADRLRKYTFYLTSPEIDMTDGTGPLVAINV